MMIEYLAQDEGLITHQLIFKDTGISDKGYKKLEKLVKKYDRGAVLTHVPVADEVVIIVNKRCQDDECRESESERFIEYYNKVLRKVK